MDSQPNTPTNYASILSQASTASAKIKALYLERDAQQKRKDSRLWEVELRFRKIEHATRDKKNAEEKVITDFADKKRAALDGAIEANRAAPARLARIFAFMHLARNMPAPPVEVEISTYRDRKFKKILGLGSTEYLNLGLFIVENDKPVNSFDLAVIGSSIFDADLLPVPQMNAPGLGYPRSAWVRIEKGQAQINQIVRSFPTIEEGDAWAEANFIKILPGFADRARAVMVEFNEVKENCTGPAWERAYLESRKAYYENEYSHGTETPEYAEILKQIKKMEASA